MRGYGSSPTHPKISLFGGYRVWVSIQVAYPAHNLPANPLQNTSTGVFVPRLQRTIVSTIFRIFHNKAVPTKPIWRLCVRACVRLIFALPTLVFVGSYFTVPPILFGKHTNPQILIGCPHKWRFLVCVCLASSQPESYLLRDINCRQSPDTN